MNKRLIIFFLVFSLFLTFACGILEDLVERLGGDTVGEYVASQMDRQMNPEVSQEQVAALVHGNTQFAVAIYDQIREDEENLIFSPFSLSLALSMALAGAESETEREMLSALQISLSEGEVYPAFNAVLLSIEASEDMDSGNNREGFKLNLANGLWAQAGFPIRSTFLDTLALNFGVGVYQVDFESDAEGARRGINRWVSNETDDHIWEILGPRGVDPTTRLLLANAIYFKAAWDEAFDKGATQKVPFYLLDGGQVTVDMMKIWDETFAYHQGSDYQAVAVDYLNPDFDMIIVLPDQGAFQTVEDRLSTDFIQTTLDSLSYQDVNLQMPRFDFDYQFEATPVLENLGMTTAFIPIQADFSGVTSAEPLFISSVAHKATITVDEEGTEAAAATTIMFGLGAAPPGEPITLIIDRPFILFIVHNRTDSLLFMGRVLQP
jgi:serpin B